MNFVHDALSVQYDKERRRVLGIHIPDVSHFVRENSALDKEAYKRATSVYLVDKVVPMLPEQLSNGVCSLVPDKDRLAFSAFLTLNKKGQVEERRFTKSHILSKLRLTYEDAFDLIEERKPESGKKVPAEAAKMVRELNAIAQTLRKERMRRNALNIEVPETQIVLDDKGMMIVVRATKHDVAHELVEECMVAANEAVAAELANRGTAIISRLHEPPEDEKLVDLAGQLTQLGFKPGDLTIPSNLTALARSLVGHPLRYHASVQVLKSMKRALYSAEGTGHYGLAKKLSLNSDFPSLANRLGRTIRR